MADETTVQINGQTYQLSPLRCKHLKQISRLIVEKQEMIRTMTWQALSLWTPFMGDSIRYKHPDFKDELLEELTLPDFLETWNKIIGMSGIQFTSKPGEAIPAESTGQESTADSSVPSAGTIVQ